MESNNLKIVLELLEKEKALEAKKVFGHIAPVETPDYLFVKGKIEQKFQNWGEAINAYSKVLEMEPNNKEAQNNLHLINNILNFWNPDMFNP